MSNRSREIDELWAQRAEGAYVKSSLRPWKTILVGTVAIIVLMVVLILGGKQFGWWLQGQNLNHEAHNLRQSYGNQQALRDDITQKFGIVATVTAQIEQGGTDVASLKAQRFAIAGIVCSEAEQVSTDPLPVDQSGWVRTNCENGAVSPASPIAQH